MQEKAAKGHHWAPSFLANVSKINLVYTVLLFLNYYAYAMSINILGPAMIDLAKVYGESIAFISKLLVANSVGYMAGSLVGWTFKWVNRQLVYSMFSLLLAVSNLLPLYSPAWTSFLGITLAGVGMGVIGSVTNIWLMDMWPGTGTEAVLQICQFCYGLGSISAPILASKFIYGEANVTSTGQVLSRELRRANLMTPFGISSAIQAIAPLALLILFIFNRYRPPVLTPKSNPIPRKSISFAHRASIFELPSDLALTETVPHRKLKLALGCALFAAYFTSESGYFPYIVTMWQTMGIHLSATEAATVLSVLSGAYTIGPVVTALVSLKLSIDNIISYHFIFLFTGYSVLYFGQNNRRLIYGGSAVLGYGMSAMIPGIQAFANRHFKLSNRVGSLYGFVSGTVSLVFPLVIGPFIETAPALPLYLASCFVLLALLLFITLRLWILFSK